MNEFCMTVPKLKGSVDGGLQNDSFESACPEDGQKDFAQSRRIVLLAKIGKDAWNWII